MSATQGAAGPQAGVVTSEGTDFTTLLNKEFKPRSDRAAEAVQEAVQTLARQALANTALLSDDALTTINRLIAGIDAKLTEQVNLVMHDESFQQLESAWRGLHYLVNNTETDETLKIKVLNVSKKDVGKSLKKFRGTAWDQSPLFKKIYEEEYGQFGGEPFGLLMGDYYFDHSPMDTQLLGDLAGVASRRPRTVPGRRRALRHANGQLERTGQPAGPDQDLPDPGICRLALAARERGRALYRPRHAALPGPPAVWRENRTGRGVRVRGRHRGCRQREVHLVQCGLRHGHQHHARVQAVWLDHAYPRCGKRRARSRACRRIPSRATMAVSR